jgi:acyl-CoA thioester hydrolase
MQEAAFDASAAAGYPFARYEAMGKLWLVRETDIEFYLPLQYGDRVEITTWVVDFRRVRSRRAYQFRIVGQEENVARAQTDWAFLDMDNERPAPIPKEMVRAFHPEGTPEAAPPRQRFPKAPPQPPGVFRQARRVEWRDIDSAQHVNNAAYLAYIEDCELRAAARIGWSPDRCVDAGISLLPQQHRISYRQPAILDDELALSLWYSELTRSTILRHCEISRVPDGAPIAQARSLITCRDQNTQRPTAWPKAFLIDLGPMTAAKE